jgi:hypothetical protein
MLVGPISRYRLRPPHPASPSPCLFWLTVVRLAPVLPDQNLRAAVRLAAVFAPGALQGLLSLDRLPRFNRQQLPKAVGVAMGTTVFRIRIELIFRRCGCPSADNLRLVGRFAKGGSGSSGLEFRRPAADAASVGLR